LHDAAEFLSRIVRRIAALDGPMASRDAGLDVLQRYGCVARMPPMWQMCTGRRVRIRSEQQDA